MGVALRDIIAEYKIPVTWETLPGIAAIDANNALYQFLTIIRQPDGTPLMDRQGRVTSHLSGILSGRPVSWKRASGRSLFLTGNRLPSSRPPSTSAGSSAIRRGEVEGGAGAWR